ncbi:LIM domain-containing protein WLIM2b [Forsythia ovata]|uniref:LIM domain-containing protein WLIM2b n=1 Tax=Forsythia ovata TaxID=205694 RepID=A0ABD1W567_9LAMI
MAFYGTVQKCKACDKTVHFAETMSADGVPYHKNCFKCSHCNGRLANRTPSKVSTFFSGTQEKCAVCTKTVYPLEKVTVEGQFYHKTCFRCAHGGCNLTTSNYAALDGILYCKPHFAQLFKEKGSYSHLTKTTSLRKNVGESPAELDQPKDPKLDESEQLDSEVAQES